VGTPITSATLTPINVFSAGSTSAVASDSNAISGELDPTSTGFGGTGTGPGYQRGIFTFSTGSTPLASVPSGMPAVYLYFLLPADGTLTGTPTSWTTDAGRSTYPATYVAVAIPLDTVNLTQTYASVEIDIPPVPFRVIAANAGTGLAFPAGWWLTLTPTTDLGA
jgi:hypothetical protein